MIFRFFTLFILLGSEISFSKPNCDETKNCGGGVAVCVSGSNQGKCQDQAHFIFSRTHAPMVLKTIVLLLDLDESTCDYSQI